MKNLFNLLLLFTLISAISCRSSKDLTYLADATLNETIKGLPNASIEHITVPKDILYVSIKTTNEEVNKLYNPESAMSASGSNSSMMFSSPNGAYLYGFEIDNDGDIKLPMLGKLKVAGLTRAEVEKVVQKKADEFLSDAIVKVKLLNFRFSLMGEVKSPGVYYNYNNAINLFEALAMGGGHSDFASIKDVMVVRPTAEGNKTYLLDLTSKEIYSSEAFYIHPNDNIIVRPGSNKNLSLNAPAISLFFASFSFLVSVVTFTLLLTK